MKIRITYNNGHILEDNANYLHFTLGNLVYTVNKQVHDVIQDRVNIPLGNIKKFHMDALASEGAYVEYSASENGKEWIEVISTDYVDYADNVIRFVSSTEEDDGNEYVVDINNVIAICNDYYWE